MKKDYKVPTLKILGQLTVITTDNKGATTFDQQTQSNSSAHGGG